MQGDYMQIRIITLVRAREFVRTHGFSKKLATQALCSFEKEFTEFLETSLIVCCTYNSNKIYTAVASSKHYIERSPQCQINVVYIRAPVKDTAGQGES